ncbi:MAG TPA: DUF192 domain-containing protein [Bacillota bacterium]|nr:DUF192 domain-containing protein [Bacillota bacterium]
MIRTFFYKKKVGQQVYSIELLTAFTFWQRFLGFMGRAPGRYGMIFNRTNQVHMFFMCFSLDVYFLDRNGVVLHVDRALKPWRLSSRVKNAYYVIELPVGHGVEMEVGDRVEMM